ncbi:MAG: type II secretion system minor pseudopilin GspJ [Cellvibrionaceae bacterium]
MRPKLAHYSFTGFTLIEMLVALAIGAAIAALSYQALDGVIKADERVTEVIDQINEVDRVWQYMSNDLLAAVPRTWFDYQGEQQPALYGPGGDRLSQSDVLVADGDDYVLRFIRANRRNILNVSRSDLFIVGYRLTIDESNGNDEKILWRDSWSPVDGSEEPKVQQRLLLSGIKDMQLSYCSTDFNIQLPRECNNGGWPAVSGTTTAVPNLPAAVMVTLETSNFGELRRLFGLAIRQ